VAHIVPCFSVPIFRPIHAHHLALLFAREHIDESALRPHTTMGQSSPIPARAQTIALRRTAATNTTCTQQRRAS